MASVRVCRISGMAYDDAKARLRREALAAREAMLRGERVRLGGEIRSKILALPEYGSSQTVLAYCGFGTEMETGKFLDAVLRDGKRLVLPRVDRSRKSLVLHRVDNPDSELVAGMWGIMEPDESLPEVGISDVDFALLPGVAFDRAGGRLGYGGGYYDRMLGGAERRPVLVAAAFELQIVPSVPVTTHDVRVDILVTEDSTLRFAAKE